MAPGRFDRLAAGAGRLLGRIDPRSDPPHGLVRLGVALCVSLALGVGLVYFAKALDELGTDAGVHAEANTDDRELAGSTSLGLVQEALTEARGLIPERGAYRLVVGPDATNVGQFVRYFLMPRRPTADARWVLCYACDRSSLGAELDVLWRDDAGNLVGRLRR